MFHYFLIGHINVIAHAISYDNFLNLMKAVIRHFICTAVAAFCMAGCGGHKRPEKVVGDWECKNLSAAEHVEQFAANSMVLFRDGKYTSQLKDRNGIIASTDHGFYRTSDGMLQFCGDASFHGDTVSSFQYSVVGDEMILTLIDMHDRDNNDKTVRSLHYFRKR